jgi:hypothetical protein
MTRIRNRIARGRAGLRPSGTGRSALGRRLGDPADVPVQPGTRAVRGRLAGVSVRASVAAGAWVGFALGIVLGAVVGALIVWFAGAVVDWQRDLAFTLGVARRLLPFGDQLSLLREVQTRWWLVIPVVALVIAAVTTATGALLAGIFAALYNRSPRHAVVIVELPDSALAGGTVPTATASTADQADSPRSASHSA